MDAEVIAELLEALDWQPARLAAELRVSQSTLNRWIRKDHIPEGPAVVVIRRLMKRAERQKTLAKSA